MCSMSGLGYGEDYRDHDAQRPRSDLALSFGINSITLSAKKWYERLINLGTDTAKAQCDFRSGRADADDMM